MLTGDGVALFDPMTLFRVILVEEKYEESCSNLIVCKEYLVFVLSCRLEQTWNQKCVLEFGLEVNMMRKILNDVANEPTR